MKMKPVDPNAVIRDPHTKRPLPVEGDDVPDNDVFYTRRWLAGETWRMEGQEWVRRTPSGELVRERAATSSQPTGREPVAPLNTRGQ